MIADFHIHSHYSYDSLNPPRMILKIAKKKGLDTVAITDHNTIKGGICAQKYAKEMGINVIVGEEVLTNIGDIIGLYLSQDIHSFNYVDVIEEIHNQGGIVLFPHPYRGHTNILDVAQYVDIIEIWNGRASEEQNLAASVLAETLNLSHVIGSDAHLPNEIGAAVARYSSNLELQEIINQYSIPKCNVVLSQVMKKYNIPSISRKIFV